MFLLDVSARTNLIVGTYFSSGAIALFFVQLVLAGFAILVWIAVALLNAYESAQATE
jgi:hypothetical protein